MPKTAKRRAPKNPQRVKPVATRWILAWEEEWSKVEAATRELEGTTPFPGKLTVNRVASMIFRRAVRERTISELVHAVRQDTKPRA